MTAEPVRPGRRVSYGQARAALVATGLVVIGVVALIMYARRVETVEVIAVALFVPVFLAFVTWDAVGGLLAALVASAIYLGLRSSAIHAVGFSTFAGLIASRVIGLLVFGLVGGWANGLLRASLAKLDLYDQIDDETGLFNARYFVLETDLEKARSDRYRTFFSVAVLDVPASWLDGLGRRQKRRLLRELGHLLQQSVRTIDRASHCIDGEAHRLAVIMPETGSEGAGIFAERLASQLTDWLGQHGVATATTLQPLTLTIPPDETTLAELRSQFLAVSQMEHPRSTAMAGS